MPASGFLASCHGCHVVTVRHLRGPVGGLHPVRRRWSNITAVNAALHPVSCDGALRAGLQGTRAPIHGRDRNTRCKAIYCRCTGYEPIVRPPPANVEAGGQLAIGCADCRTRPHDRHWSRSRQPGRARARGMTARSCPPTPPIWRRCWPSTLMPPLSPAPTDVGLWVTEIPA